MPPAPSLLSLTALILQGRPTAVVEALALTTKPVGQVAVVAAIERDDPAILEAVLARTVLPWDGFIPRAAKEGRVNALRVLLNQPLLEKTGKKALRAAAQDDQWGAFALLLDHTDPTFVLANFDDRTCIVHAAPASIMATLLTHPYEAKDVRDALDMAIAFGQGRRLDMAQVLAPHVSMETDEGLLRRAAQSSEAMLDLIFPRVKPATVLTLATAFLNEQTWRPLDSLAARMPTHNQRALVFGHETVLPRTHALVVQHDLAHGRAERATLEPAGERAPHRPRPRP